jgi:hypothetical protein
MLRPPRFRLATAVVLAGVSLLSACIVVPSGRRYSNEVPYAGGGEVVTVAPPQPEYEVVGVAPVAGYIWIGGFWNWVGGRHMWVGGRWEAPRQGYGYVPHRWQQDGRGWRANPGRWERR